MKRIDKVFQEKRIKNSCHNHIASISGIVLKSIGLAVIFGLSNLLGGAEIRTLLDDAFAMSSDGTLKDWRRYGQGAVTVAPLPDGMTRTRFVSEGKLIISRTLPVRGGQYYRLRLESLPIPGRSPGGAFLSLALRPAQSGTNQLYQDREAILTYDPDDRFAEVRLSAPAGVDTATVAIETRQGAPEFQLIRLTLEESDAPFEPRQADPQKVPGVLEPAAVSRQF